MQNQELTIEDLNQQIRCVSHEIRNHLSICDMYSQIIKRNLEKEGINNKSIENALDCIQKSIQIIGTNLLDLKSLNQTTPQIIDFERVITRGIELSKAYTIYGCQRTGCCACPFSKNLKHDLKVLWDYEPLKYKAMMHWLKDVYIYQEVECDWDEEYMKEYERMKPIIEQRKKEMIDKFRSQK